MKRYFSHICFLLLSFSIIQSCADNFEDSQQHYYTWDGLEPDKWASVWLVNRHIDPKAVFSIVPVGASVRDAIAVDTPDSKYKRSHGRATFENMVRAFKLSNDPALIKMGDIINSLEVTAWSSSNELVTVVETQFRAMQMQFNRENVPATCYSGFYDQLYEGLNQPGELNLNVLAEIISPEKVCDTTAHAIAERSDMPVHEYSIDHILKMINQNKKVVFVDTREDDEYSDYRIPGAINLKLRDVNESTPDQYSEHFNDADLIISYCIKDFRGYEVALALHRVGVEKVAIMKPYGIRGWMDTGLPVAGPKGLPEKSALSKLKACAEMGQCKEIKG